MFHVIQDAFCIARCKNGVYKQTKVYKYKDGLYIGHGGGFVRLMRNGDVATPNMSYVELELPSDISVTWDNIGRLTYKEK